MKLIMAIVNDSDVKNVNEAMMKGGYSLTKIGSSGGFLKSGVTTLLSAVSNERIDYALEIIRESTHAHKYRTTDIDVAQSYAAQLTGGEIVVGGATVFVLNIENSYKY